MILARGGEPPSRETTGRPNGGVRLTARRGEIGLLDVRLFGPCRVFRNGVEMPLPQPQPTTALKILALRGGVIHEEKLALAVWPDEDPAISRPRVRNLLSKIRRATGAQIQQRDDSVRVLDAVRCDIVEFIQLASRVLADVDDPRERNRLCLEAQALWVGPPLEEDRYEEWGRLHRHRAYELQRLLWDLLPEQPPGPQTSRRT